MISNPIRVLIADKHEFVRKGIRALLSTTPDIQVVGDASNGQDAIDQTKQLCPDVILMGLIMPEVNSAEAIRCIRSQQITARILVLTSFATDDQVILALKAGADGYLLKESGPRELIQAIRQVQPAQLSDQQNIPLA